MKKLVSLLIVLFLTAGIGFSAEKTNTINVISSATKEVEPDRVTINFVIETEAKTAQEASLLNAQKANKVLARIKPVINTNNGDYIKTSSVSLHPVYSYDKETSKQLLNGYKAQCNFLVDTSDVARLGQMIDLAVDSGATGTNNLSMYLKNTDKVYLELISEATKQAYTKASSAVGALGEKVGKLKSITIEDYNRGTPVYAKALYSLNADAAQANQTLNVEKGKIKLSATVNAVFYIK